MSKPNYTVKPDWTADGSLSRTGYDANIFASKHGWIAPPAGMGAAALTSIAGDSTNITVVATAHGLVSGQSALITGVATTTAYNGLHDNITVVDADTFTIASTITGAGVVTSAKVYKSFEVMWALGNLDSIAADISVAPTFTAGIAYSGTAAVVTGDVITLTLTASEAIYVQGKPTVDIVIGLNTRKMNLASTTDTTAVFTYTAVAGDAAIAGGVVVGTTSTGGYVSDVLPQGKKALAAVTFVTPDTTLTTVN